MGTTGDKSHMENVNEVCIGSYWHQISFLGVKALILDKTRRCWSNAKISGRVTFLGET